MHGASKVWSPCPPSEELSTSNYALQRGSNEFSVQGGNSLLEGALKNINFALSIKLYLTLMRHFSWLKYFAKLFYFVFYDCFKDYYITGRANPISCAVSLH